MSIHTSILFPNLQFPPFFELTLKIVTTGAITATTAKTKTTTSNDNYNDDDDDDDDGNNNNSNNNNVAFQQNGLLSTRLSMDIL